MRQSFRHPVRKRRCCDWQCGHQPREHTHGADEGDAVCVLLPVVRYRVAGKACPVPERAHGVSEHRI